MNTQKDGWLKGMREMGVKISVWQFWCLVSMAVIVLSTIIFMFIRLWKDKEND
jgi:hypothetical protein